jgi:hypothetical protein
MKSPWGKFALTKNDHNGGKTGDGEMENKKIKVHVLKNLTAID